MTLANPTLETMREELRVDETFLSRYNRPGPRYTSYPTAPVWNDSFGPADLERVHAQADEAKSPVSLYMHIPFCESLCLFCACNVIIQKNKAVSPPYLETLKREITTVSQHVSKSRQVVQFHWGGGTPTYLTPHQIEDLFGFTRDHFNFSPDAEIGIEVDPRVTSREHLETLRKLGFNRLSMGIQDFHPLVQKTINRVQPYELTASLIQSARDLGFDSVNVDLIYGLPYQTAETFAHTVDQILTLTPDRVALFSYAHVPWLKKQQNSFEGHLPEGMQKFEIFRTGLLKFRSRLPLHRHGPFRQIRRRASRLPAKSNPPPQFSGLHHKSRRRPVRHGHYCHQRHPERLRPKSARDPQLGKSRQRTRHRHHARLPSLC